MDRTPLNNANIRKIIIGDAKEGLAWVKGQKYGRSKEFTITKIIRDENAYFLFGNVTYLVYAKKDNEQEKIWKLFERQPVCCEYEF